MHTALGAGTVYVWEGGLDQPAAAVVRARSLLSDDELVRADRFRYDRHRRRFTLARATLRRVLGHITDTPPEGVRFRYGDQGKPYLPDGPSFNLSHSGDRVLIGVTGSGRLGVDLEEIKPVREMDDLALRNFAGDESTLLLATPLEDRPTVFFRIWTRKEAFLKALGGGLSISLKSFSVDPDPTTPVGLIRVDDPEEVREEWQVVGLEIAPGAEAAIAIDRPDPLVAPLPFDPADSAS